MATEEKVRRFLVETFLFSDDPSILGASDSLLESGVIDSTGILELIQFIETEFAVQVADEDMVPENLDSLSRIVSFVERKRGEAQRA